MTNPVDLYFVHQQVINIVSLTSKQQDIIKCINDNETIDNSVIAERVDCSESYASRVRREYRHLTGELMDVNSDNIWPIFSEPYSVYVDANYAEKRFLELGEPVEVLRNNPAEDNDSKDQTREVACLNNLDDINFEKEVRGLFYATKSIFSKLSGELEEKLKKFEGEEEDDVAIHTQEDLKDYLTYIEGILRKKQKTKEIHIGIGILSGLRSIPSDHQGFPNNNPYFLTYEKLIEKCINEIDFVDDIRKLNADIVTPERISYVQHGETSSDSNNIIKETILKRKYAQADCREKYQIDTFTHGPKPSVDSDKIIKSNPENIEFHKHKTQAVTFSSPMENEKLFDLIEDKKLKIDIDTPFGQLDKGENEIKLKCFKSEDHLFILFGKASVDIRINGETLIAGYPRPIEPIVNEIFDIFRQELDMKIYNRDHRKKWDRKTSDNWILDTNAVYHEIDENVGSSILRTILTNRNIMDSKIHIPWIVLYEMNKHKDEGGPDAPIQEGGIENLRLLQTLSEYGFIDLLYQDFPDNIPSNVQESSVSDLYLSKYAQETGGIVISGDQRLRNLNSMSGIETVDLYSYANVETVPDIEDHTKERVLNNIGEDFRTHSEIIEKLKKEIEKAGTTRMEHHNSIPNRQINQEKLPENANDYLQQWTEENELIVYPSSDSKRKNNSEDAEEVGEDAEKYLMYEKTSVHNVVPTMSVVSKISKNITEFDGDKYLGDGILEKFSELVNYQGTGKPTMHFHFPIASVISYQSTTTGRLSREGTRLYKLKQIRNSDYTTEELNQADRDDVIHDSVLLAKENDCALLCGDDEEYLQRIGELIGVNVIVYT